MSDDKIEVVRKTLPKSKRTGRPRKYPFHRMSPGDSFQAESSYINMWGCLQNYLKKADTRGRKFKIRAHPEKDDYVEVFCVKESWKREPTKKPNKNSRQVPVKKPKYDL